MSRSFKILIQYGCPQHLLSKLTGYLAECRWRWFKNWAINRLIKKHGVRLDEALSDNIEDYPTFNSFFTRKLKPELRPIVQEPGQLASPVDGVVSQAGEIRQELLFQAKQFHYSLNSLLGNAEEANLFKQGYFATFYLAPKDYHRVHMPIAGKLKSTLYIPGKLFSVNQQTVQAVPSLFARNERLVCFFDTAVGPMAIILVGAMLVGKIEMVWPMTTPFPRLSLEKYPESIYLNRGDELGRFKMGSTVIVLFGKNAIQWCSTLKEDVSFKMGQLIGNAN